MCLSYLIAFTLGSTRLMCLSYLVAYTLGSTSIMCLSYLIPYTFCSTSIMCLSYLIPYTFCSTSIIISTKGLNAQHLVEYQKLFLQEENKKLGNAMQQTMHSYVCGINLRSESSLVSDLHFA